MKKIILTLAFAVIAFAASFAQESYKWDNGTGFVLPEGMKITENADGQVTATTEDGLFMFSIIGVEFEKIRAKKIGEFLGEIAFDKMKMNPGEGQYVIEPLSIKNGEGLYIVGVDTDNELPCIAGVFLCESKKIGCYVIMAFEEQYAEEAGKVLGQIYFE